jgi:arginine/ornithine transport system permease protein
MLAGAIRETSAGEIEAAQAYGMGRWQRHAGALSCPAPCAAHLPAYSNEAAMMLQSTSLASAAPSMLDVTSAASRVLRQLYLPFEAYICRSRYLPGGDLSVWWACSAWPSGVFWPICARA